MNISPVFSSSQMLIATYILGVNVKLTDFERGRNVMHYFVESEQPMDFLKVLELLLNYGASLDQEDKHGVTPISVLITNNKTQQLEFILQLKIPLKMKRPYHDARTGKC